MCRAKSKGDRRCPTHKPESRQAQRRAVVAKRKHPRKTKDIDCTNTPDCENGVIRVRDEQGSYISQSLCQMCGGLGYLNDAAGRIADLPRARKAHGSSEASKAHQAFKELHGAKAAAEAAAASKAGKTATAQDARAARAAERAVKEAAAQQAKEAKLAAAQQAKEAKAPISIKASKKVFQRKWDAAETDADKVDAFLEHLENTAVWSPSDAAWLEAARGCTDTEILAAANEMRRPVRCSCVDGKREAFDGHTDKVIEIDCAFCDPNATDVTESVA